MNLKAQSKHINPTRLDLNQQLVRDSLYQQHPHMPTHVRAFYFDLISEFFADEQITDFELSFEYLEEDEEPYLEPYKVNLSFRPDYGS